MFNKNSRFKLAKTATLRNFYYSKKQSFSHVQNTNERKNTNILIIVTETAMKRCYLVFVPRIS